MPISLDRRTLSDDDAIDLFPENYFTEIFHGLAAANGSLMAEAMATLDAPPLTFEVGDVVWSIISSGTSIDAVPHAVEGALVLTFEPTEFSDLIQNQRSLNAFMVMRSLRHRGGDVRDISIWDSLLHCLQFGWPVVGHVDFFDRHGQPLDLHQAFTPDDDSADIAHFLREAGYLHLRGWVDPAMMPLISADMDRMLPAYEEGDGKSWWAQLADGTRVCVRLQEFVEHSPTTAAMLSSERWDQLRRTIAADDDVMQPPVEGRCIEALLKPVGVVSGPSDLTFHRDCHIGRHGYNCSGITVGISITSSSTSNGQLRVAAGSHRIAMPVEIAKTDPYLQVVALDTEVGDLTVHLSCTLHEATAPTIEERRVMYTNFALAERPSLSAGKRALLELREQVTHILREADADTA